jgi:hypothetical protein
VKVCRGHVAVAPPFAAAMQTYHWSAVVHPQDVFHQLLTPDEAAWVVLWTQGLSETGGARMKTYSVVVGTVKWTAVIALSVASGGAMAAAGSAAIASGAGVGVAFGQMAAISAVNKVAVALTGAAANRAELSGINGIAAGVFDKADHWAFENAKKLGVNPRAGLALHQKMVEQGSAKNAFALDEERLTKMHALVATLPQEPTTTKATTEAQTSAGVELFSVSSSSEIEAADLSEKPISSNAPISVAVPE